MAQLAQTLRSRSPSWWSELFDRVVLQLLEVLEDKQVRIVISPCAFVLSSLLLLLACLRTSEPCLACLLLTCGVCMVVLGRRRCERLRCAAWTSSSQARYHMPSVGPATESLISRCVVVFQASRFAKYAYSEAVVLSLLAVFRETSAQVRARCMPSSRVTLLRRFLALTLVWLLCGVGCAAQLHVAAEAALIDLAAAMSADQLLPVRLYQFVAARHQLNRFVLACECRFWRG